MNPVIVTLFAALSITIMNVITKLVQTHIDESIIVFIRVFVSMMILFPLIHLKHNETLKTKRYPLHLLRATTGFISIYLLALSLKFLPVSNATLLFMTYPLFAPILLAIFLKNSLSLSSLIAIVIGFIGVLLVLHPNTHSFLQHSALIGLGSGFLAAIGVLIVKKLASTEPASRIVFYFSLNATIIALIPTYHHWKTIDLFTGCQLITIGIFGLLYQYCLAYALQHGKTVLVMPTLYTAIIFGTLADWFMGIATPHINTLFGFMCVFLGVIWVMMDERVRQLRS